VFASPAIDLDIGHSLKHAGNLFARQILFTDSQEVQIATVGQSFDRLLAQIDSFIRYLPPACAGAL
jgi:hypothetical protein